MIEIVRDSPAWNELRLATSDPETRKVTLDVRPDGLAVKVNELMWSPTLRAGQRLATIYPDDGM